MAETLMQTEPDSALIVLQTIDQQHIPQGNLQARWALLYTQALDKNNLPLSGDSLINIAVAYYGHKKDYRRLGWAYLYQGNAYVEMDSIALAMNAYLKAQEIVERADDDYLLGLITNKIAGLHQAQRNYVSALMLFHKSLSAFQKMGHIKNESHALLQIGRVLYISEAPLDSAQYYYDQAREKAIEINDPELLYTVSASQAAILRERNQYALAKQLLLATIHEYKQGVIPLEWYPLLSVIYLDLQQIDSARHYIQLLLHDTRATAKQRAGAFAILKDVEDQSGNFQMALYYAAQYKALSDTVIQTLHDQSLPLIEQKYLIKELVNKHLIQKIRYWTTVVVLALLAIACVLGVRYLWKKRLARQGRRHEEVTTQQHESMIVFRRSSLSENWNTTLFLKEFESGVVPREEGAFFVKAQKVANLAYPGLSEWLKRGYSQLSESDTVLTFLLLSGYRSKRLCVFFGVPDNRTMRARCSRLYKRLGIKTDPKDPHSFRIRLMDLYIANELSQQFL